MKNILSNLETYMKQKHHSKTGHSPDSTAGKVATDFRYSRTIKKSIQPQYSDFEHITILEGLDQYWIYDEDAEKVSAIFGFELYKTKKGYSLVYKKSFHQDFIESMKAQGINCVIVHPDTIEVIVPSCAIELNKLFKMEDSSGSIGQYIIKILPRKRNIEIHAYNDSTQIMSVPDIDELTNTKFEVISHRTKMAALLLGKHVGDEITINGDTYKIIEI